MLSSSVLRNIGDFSDDFATLRDVIFAKLDHHCRSSFWDDDKLLPKFVHHISVKDFEGTQMLKCTHEKPGSWLKQ